MKSTFIIKLFLLLLLISAFLIRFWGIQFDDTHKLFNHDSGYHLRFARYFYQGHINPYGAGKTFFSVLYPHLFEYLMALTAWIYTGIKYIWATIVYFIIHQPFPQVIPLSGKEWVLLSRFYSIVIGTALVYLIYRLGSSLLGKKEALIGACFAAFAPQLAFNSRFIANETTLTFFIVLSVLFSSYILTRGHLKWYLLAGLAAGFAVGAKQNGIIVLFSVLGAHFLRVRQEGQSWRRLILDKKLGLALAFFLVGILVSYPILWLETPTIFRMLPKYSRRLRGFNPAPGTFWQQRWINILQFGRDASAQTYFGIGPWIFILGLGGLIKGIASRNLKKHFLVIFPLLYLVIALLIRQSLRHKDFIPANIFLCLLAAYFLVWLLNLLKIRNWLKNTLTTGVVLLILSPSILVDVRMDYCAWRQDTRYLAGDWIWENIPFQSRIYRESYGPPISSRLHKRGKKRFLWWAPVQQYIDAGVEYLVRSSLASDRFFDPYEPSRKEQARNFYNSLEEEFWRQKVFRTESGGPINPVIKIYNLKRKGPEWRGKSLILRDLDFDFSDSSPEILVLEDDLGYEGKSGFWVRHPQPEKRLLIAPRRLKQIGLEIHPARVPSKIKVYVGRKKETITFHSPQPQLCLFEPSISFPFLKYSYQIKAKSRSEDPFLIKILTSPHQLTYAFARRGEYEKARTYQQEPFASIPEQWNFKREAFDQSFKDFFREDPSWYRKKYSRIYEAEEHGSLTGEKELDSSASGEKAMVFYPGKHQPGYLLFGPYVHLPPQVWVASFRMKIKKGEEREEVAILDVCCDKGKRILAERVLRREDFSTDDYSNLTLPFFNDHLVNDLEFRIRARGEVALWCDRVEVFPDLEAWLKNYRDKIFPPEKF